MKKTIRTSIAISSLFLVSCGGLTEDQARTKLNSEAEILSTEACACINNLNNIEGDALIEADANCRRIGQSALYDLGHDEGIDKDYPTVVEDAEQKYFELIDKCAH